MRSRRARWFISEAAIDVRLTNYTCMRAPWSKNIKIPADSLYICPIKVSFVISHFFSFFKVIQIIYATYAEDVENHYPSTYFWTILIEMFGCFLFLIPISINMIWIRSNDSKWWFRWIEQHCFLWCRSLHLYLHRYSYACYFWSRNEEKKIEANHWLSFE